MKSLEILTTSENLDTLLLPPTSSVGGIYSLVQVALGSRVSLSFQFQVKRCVTATA
jgi:hypothetical protein